ncbi:MAG: folate-binding protein, partial [Rickettsiales bacterium]|nr:folate-binding protein [Rickettsiales bacterium]
MFLLENRSVIEVAGDDRVSFLQGLLTNDINKASPSNLLYALMLTPQGRFLYDFFILEQDSKILLDAPKEYIDEIIKKFSIYKLRSNVTFSISKKNVYATFDYNENFLPDPRSEKMGYRIISNHAFESLEDFNLYEDIRIKNKIPDAVKDFIKDKSFPLEYGTDKMHAIDFNKG